MRKLSRAIIPIVSSYAFGIFASLSVSSNVGVWYDSIAKAPGSPPEYIFPIGWIIMYGLMGIACAIVWLDDSRIDHHANWVRFFFIHLLFSMAWIMFFFGFHSILLSLIDILFVLFMVMALTVTAYETDKRAGYLLMPYLAWIVFSAYLNFGVWSLN